MRGRAGLGSMVVGLVAVVLPGSAEGPATLTGFDAAGTAAQQQLETKFVGALRKDDLKGWLERLAARPHHVGSPYDKENAEFIAVRIRQAGGGWRGRRHGGGFDWMNYLLVSKFIPRINH